MGWGYVGRSLVEVGGREGSVGLVLEKGSVPDSKVSSYS